MSRKYFGTDGVRGRVGQTPITPEFAMLLAQAAGRILKQQTTDGEVGVFIGKDTRVSGYMLEAALQAGFLSAGVDVMLGGPLPTPAVAYLTRAQRLSAGVVISASHNPFYDNGIKFFSDKGTKLPDEMELQIEREMDRGFNCVDSARQRQMCIRDSVWTVHASEKPAVSMTRQAVTLNSARAHSRQIWI